MFTGGMGYGRPKSNIYGVQQNEYDDGSQPQSMIGDGSAGSPITVGGDPSLHLSQMSQPRNKWQSFLGGMQGGRGVAGGLSTLAGGGGFGGAIGGMAKFLL